MELDDLKTKWQEGTDHYSKINQKDMKQLEMILRNKTSDFISSMKKKYEKIISIMLGSMLLTVLIHPVMSDGFTYPGSVNGFAKVMFFYLILIIFYWGKLLGINRLELSDHIKERLEQLSKMLKRNKRIEVSFIIAFFVISLLVGRFFYGKGLSDLDDLGFRISIPLLIVFIGAVILVVIKRYKKQLRELDEYLSEYEKGE